MNGNACNTTHKCLSLDLLFVTSSHVAFPSQWLKNISLNHFPHSHVLFLGMQIWTAPPVFLNAVNYSSISTMPSAAFFSFSVMTKYLNSVHVFIEGKRRTYLCLCTCAHFPFFFHLLPSFLYCVVLMVLVDIFHPILFLYLVSHF